MKIARWILILSLVLPFAATAVASDEKDEKGAAEIKAWMMEVVAKYQSRGWSGIETKMVEKGEWRNSKVTDVAYGSPAAKAGFQRGDVVTAINGVPLKTETLPELKKQKAQWGAGTQVTYTVSRKVDGEWTKKQIPVTLAQPPDDVVAKWVGYKIMKAFSAKSH